MDPAADFGSLVLIPDTVRGRSCRISCLPPPGPPAHRDAVGDVKLVGPSINCNDCHKDLAAAGGRAHRRPPDRGRQRRRSLLMKHWRRPSSKEQDCEYNEVGSRSPCSQRTTRSRRCRRFGADDSHPRSRGKASSPRPRLAADVGQVDGLVVVRGLPVGRDRPAPLECVRPPDDQPNFRMARPRLLGDERRARAACAQRERFIDCSSTAQNRTLSARADRRDRPTGPTDRGRLRGRGPGWAGARGGTDRGVAAAHVLLAARARRCRRCQRHRRAFPGGRRRRRWRLRGGAGGADGDASDARYDRGEISHLSQS